MYGVVQPSPRSNSRHFHHPKRKSRVLSPFCSLDDPVLFPFFPRVPSLDLRLHFCFSFSFSLCLCLSVPLFSHPFGFYFCIFVTLSVSLHLTFPLFSPFSFDFALCLCVRFSPFFVLKGIQAKPKETNTKATIRHTQGSETDRVGTETI